MIGITIRRLHILIALALLICMICPFAEMALHSDNCIFASGQDNESTLALLLLVVELCFALGKLVVVLLPRFLTKLMLVDSELLALLKPNFAVVLPDISPPLPLRI